MEALARLRRGVVPFPAASAVFTSPTDYNLSSTEYGGMFVPQAIMAIVASLLGAGLRSRLGTKRIFQLGLIANLLAMLLLVLSGLVMHQHALAYGILLVSTASMGIGFGFTVPALNTFAAAFFRRRWTSRARPECVAWVGNGARACFCCVVCRAGSLVGTAGAG